MNLLLVVFFIAIAAVSFFVNRDYLSPAKLYLFHSFYWFYDIFGDAREPVIYFIYFLILCFGLYLALSEKNYFYFNVPVARCHLCNSNRVFALIWLLSLIPMAAVGIFVYLLGGIDAFLLEFSHRVIVWRGFGYITIFSKWMPILNIFYCLVFLYFRFRIRPLHVVLFVLHLALTMFMGFISGSRSQTLFPLLNLFMIRYFSGKRVKLPIIIGFAIFLMVSAEIMNLVRRDFKYYSIGQVTFISQESDIAAELRKGKTRPGTFGLSAIYEGNFKNFQYGLTFFTTLTNMVPRVLWPGKPKSGGVILTEFVELSSYMGTSHYSPGIFPESVINFGYYFGTLFACLVILLMGWIATRSYRRFVYARVRKEVSKVVIKKLIIMLLLFQIPGAILVGEFANTFYGLIRDSMFYLVTYKILIGNMLPENRASFRVGGVK